MKKSGMFFLVAVLVFSLILGSVVSGCTETETSRLKVVTSTALMAQIVERVGGDMVDVVNIIPPAQCPGHFDVTPGDIQKLVDADLFFVHGWQGEMFTEELIATANNPELTVGVIIIEGNWMTPSVQQEAVDVIVDSLSAADEVSSAAYHTLADQYKSQIVSEETKIKNRLADKNLADINVICNEQIAGFVQWTGLNIITTYGRPDSMTPQVVKDLVDTGREENVSLIIDNLQSGADAGKGLAEELGCTRIILTNFPGGFDNTETWEKAVDYNVDLILEALGL